MDNFGTIVPIISAVNLQSCPLNTYTVLSYTLNFPVNAANGIYVLFDFGAALNSPSYNIFACGADIRMTPGLPTGQTAANSIPIPETRNIQSELSLCQRYYFSSQGSRFIGFNGNCTSTAAYSGFGLFSRTDAVYTEHRWNECIGIWVSNYVRDICGDSKLID